MTSSIISSRVITAGLLTTAIAATSLFTFVPTADASVNTISYKVTIENLSPTIITPPAIAFTTDDISYFQTGETASVAVEKVAEGGDTSELASVLTELGAYVTASDMPILPGGAQELTVSGENKGFLHLAGMLLPTNDAFVALNAAPVKKNKTQVFYANSYDAGTEANDELAVNIPGPLTGGEGFNPERDDTNIITRHAGLTGVGDIDAEQFNWEDPVLKVTVEPIVTKNKQVLRDLIEARKAEIRERFEARRAEVKAKVTELRAKNK